MLRLATGREEKPAVGAGAVTCLLDLLPGNTQADKFLAVDLLEVEMQLSGDVVAVGNR